MGTPKRASGLNNKNLVGQAPTYNIYAPFYMLSAGRPYFAINDRVSQGRRAVA